MHVAQPLQFLHFAYANRFAYPAFNAWNLEVAKALVEAANEEAAPIILQTFYGDIHYGGNAVLAATLRAVIDTSPVPILLHLDHPDGIAMVLRCLQLGHPPVLFDGGALPLAENIAATKHAVEIGHALGATVEGELGQFGGEHQGESVVETNVDDCERMVQETGLDMLAISMGSVHGQPSRLNLRLLGDIAERVRCPLVLHGGSGIPREDTDASLEMGVVKINIGAAIFHVWTDAFSVPATGDKGLSCLGVFELAAALAPFRGPPDLVRRLLSAERIVGQPRNSFSDTNEAEVRSALEAATFYARRMFDEILAAGAKPTTIFATAGWTRSRAFVELRASIFGQPVAVWLTSLNRPSSAPP